MCYTEKEYYDKALEDFVNFGEGNEGRDRTLFSSTPTEINDGPTEKPIGLRTKLPPFKGWGTLNI